MYNSTIPPVSPSITFEAEYSLSAIIPGFSGNFIQLLF